MLQIRRGLCRNSRVKQLTTWVTGYCELSVDERRELIENSLSSKTFLPTISSDLSKSVGGISTAIQLRADLENIAKPVSGQIDEIVQQWLSIACCVDSLVLNRITFDSGGSILELIARTDKVHSVRTINNLKMRLQGSRRCYALFHSAISNFPLAHIHVALTSNLADSIKSLGTMANQQEPPSHAMFYSINSTSSAFKGLSLPAHLIKSTVKDLQVTCPSVKTFSTLSPIPGFTRWLAKADDIPQLPEHHRDSIIIAATKLGVVPGNCEGQGTHFLTEAEALQGLLKIVNEPSSVWAEQTEVVDTLKGPMMWLAARYITLIKKNREGLKGSVEQVANFHMGNGAQFHRINWMGNPSLNGLRSSMGMMVNYLYDLPSLDANVSAFHAHGPPGCESGNFSQSPLLGEAVKLVLAEEK